MFSNNLSYIILSLRITEEFNDQFFIVLKADKIVRDETIEEMRDNIASRRNQI